MYMCGMKTQNQIKRTLSRPAEIAYIRGLLEINPDFHRSDLAGAVCGRFGFYDARGCLQLSGCLKALRDLEKGLVFLWDGNCGI